METKEQFRKRIGTVAHAAMKLPDFSEFADSDLQPVTPHEKPGYWKEPFEHGDPCHHIPMQKTDFYDPAEAVYAQALRDLYKLTFEENGQWLIGWNDILAFAHNRGIELEGDSDGRDS